MSIIQNNVSLPNHIYGFVRTEFCNNLKPETAGLMPCVLFGAESIPGHALGFHILREDGAVISQLPIHALCFTKDAPLVTDPSELQLWDCFGYNISVHRFTYLSDLDGSIYQPELNNRITTCHYLCTFDFFDNGFSDYPEQHKCLHFLKLWDGNFALQPNNRVQFLDKSFTTKPFDWDNPPLIETNTLEWFCETYDGNTSPPNGIHEPDIPAI